MTNAAAFKKATSASKSGFTAKRVIAAIIAITVVAITGLGWMFVNHQNNEQHDTAGIYLSAACDDKPSTTIERGHVGQFNGQQIRFDRGEDLMTTIVNFDGPARFDTIIAIPAGSAIDGSPYTVTAVNAATGQSEPINIYSGSMGEYDRAFEVC